MEEIKKRHIIAIGSLFSLGTTAINIVSNMSYYWQSLLLAFLISLIIYLFYFKLLKQHNILENEINFAIQKDCKNRVDWFHKN